MGEIKREIVVTGRAKALRPTESGAFRVVHAANDWPHQPSPQSLDAVPERNTTRSVRRDALMLALKALLRNGLEVDGISQAVAATDCDRSRPHVTDLCAADGRGMTGADLVMLGAASETFWRGVVEMRENLRERRNGK